MLGVARHDSARTLCSCADFLPVTDSRGKAKPLSKRALVVRWSISAMSSKAAPPAAAKGAKSSGAPPKDAAKHAAASGLSTTSSQSGSSTSQMAAAKPSGGKGGKGATGSVDMSSRRLNVGKVCPVFQKKA